MRCPVSRSGLARQLPKASTIRGSRSVYVKDGIAEQDDVGHGYQSLANCRGGHAAERGGARQEEAAAVDHLLWSALAGMPEVFMKIWWVPEELNLSAPAALFHSRPGYSRLSGKGPGAGGPIRMDTVRGLGPPPLPLGYASVVPRVRFERTLRGV